MRCIVCTCFKPVKGTLFVSLFSRQPKLQISVPTRIHQKKYLRESDRRGVIELETGNEAAGRFQFCLWRIKMKRQTATLFVVCTLLASAYAKLVIDTVDREVRFE